MKIICPKCNKTRKVYKICDGRYKCSLCKKYFTRNKNLIRISKELLKLIIKYFGLNNQTLFYFYVFYGKEIKLWSIARNKINI